MTPEEIREATRAGYRDAQRDIGNTNTIKSSITTDPLKWLGEVTGLDGAKKYVTESFSIWRDVSQQGYNFSGDIIGMRTAITTMRVEAYEFHDIMSKARTGILSFGGTSANSARIFAAMSDTFAQSNSNYVDTLRGLGFSNAEYNKVLLYTMQTRRSVDLENADTQKGLHDATAALAFQMEKTAQITGLSRREAESHLEEMRKDARQQAFMRGLEADMRSEYQRQSVALKGMGLEGMLKDVMTNSAPSALTQAITSATGPAGTAMYQAMIDYREALKSGNKDAVDQARARMTAAELDMQRSIKSEEVRNLVMTNNGKFADSVREFYSKMLNTVEGVERIMKLNGVTEERARQIQEEMVKGAKDGIIYYEKLKDGQLQVDITATNARRVAQAALQAGQRVTDVSVEVSKNALAIAARTGNAIPNTVLENTKGSVMQALYEQSVRMQSGLLNGEAADAFKVLLGNIVETFKTEWKEGAKGFVETITEGLKKLWAGVPKQETGSKDVFGDWFNKDWGAGGLSMLHGKEAVIPQGKLGEFMADMMKTMPNISSLAGQMNNLPMPDLSNIPQQVSSAVPTEMSNMFGNSQQTNLDDIFKQLETLNKTMSQHLPEMVNSIDKQVRATKQLSPNVGIRA